MHTLPAIHESFERIRLAKGKGKLPVIREVCQNKAVLDALILLLDPAATFGFAEKSLQKQLDKKCVRVFLYLKDLCSAFLGKTSVTDDDIAAVQLFLSRFHDDALRKFCRQFLCKTYRLGITAKTLNEALGYEAIPLMACMLANKFFDHPQAVDGKSFAVTEKLDGIRCIAVVRPDIAGVLRPVLYSRQGQRITGLRDVEKELRHLTSCYGTSLVFDGELLISDREMYPSAEQYKRTTQIVRTKDGSKTGITYHVFDLLGTDAFDSKTCDTPYYQRRQKLDTLFQCVDDCRCVQPVPVQYVGSDVNMIYQLVETERQRQHEGVMINLLNAPYAFGRTSSLLKVKVMQDCDLEIVGYEEGSGKFSGTLGALIVDYKGTRVGVGSGLGDQARRFFWDHQQECLGRVVTIQYFEETHDKNGFPSLRFPVFKEMREEGKEVSYS